MNSTLHKKPSEYAANVNKHYTKEFIVTSGIQRRRGGI